jgi:hypothetical protein
MDSAIPNSGVDARSYDRIGGILFLLAAFLLLNPLRVLYVTESVAAHVFSGTHTGEASVVLAYDIAYILFSIFVPILFFLRKRVVSFLIAVIFLANMAFVALNGTVAQDLPDATRRTTDMFRMWEMGLSAVLFAAWTAYLSFSKRVRKTFVR